MTSLTHPRSQIRLILMAMVLSGVLLGLISAPAMASPRLAAPLRQEETSEEESPDLSGVILNLEDMPPGFEELQENQKEAMTTALAQMGRALGSGSRIRTQNATGYWNADPANIQMVVSLLISPLSEVEQKNFDNTIQKPDQLLVLLARMLGSNTEAEQLAGMDDIGETSFAFSVLASTSGLDIRMEVIAARRGEVVEQILVAYLDGQQPAADVHEIARVLDDRLVQVVPPPAPEIEPFRPTDVLVPKLTTHIPTPLDISVKPAVIGTNLLLAAIVMILLTIAVELANRTLEENESFLQRVFHGFGGIFKSKPSPRQRSILFSLLALFVIILVYGLTFSLLEPGWNFLTITGIWLFLCLTIGGGIVGLADDVIQWVNARRWGAPTAMRLQPANLLIAFASTGFSRLFGIVPGFMFGSPQAIDIDQGALDKRRQSRLVWSGAATILFIGLALWLATIFTNLLLRGELPDLLSTIIGGVESLFLSIFALAVQNTFLQMLDLPGTYGRTLKRINRWVWLLLLLAITFLFYHTLINPKGNLASAWGSVSVKLFMITSAVLMVLSLLVWLFFRLVNRGGNKGVTPMNEASQAETEQAEAQAATLPASQAVVEQAEAQGTTIPDSQPVLSGETKTCPSCGETIMVEAIFCPFCNARLGEVPPDSEKKTIS